MGKVISINYDVYDQDININIKHDFANRKKIHDLHMQR